jgi:hypothetical protein
MYAWYKYNQFRIFVMLGLQYFGHFVIFIHYVKKCKVAGDVIPGSRIPSDSQDLQQF